VPVRMAIPATVNDVMKLTTVSILPFVMCMPPVPKLDRLRIRALVIKDMLHRPMARAVSKSTTALRTFATFMRLARRQVPVLTCAPVMRVISVPVKRVNVKALTIVYAVCVIHMPNVHPLARPFTNVNVIPVMKATVWCVHPLTIARRIRATRKPHVCPPVPVVIPVRASLVTLDQAMYVRKPMPVPPIHAMPKLFAVRQDRVSSPVPVWMVIWEMATTVVMISLNVKRKKSNTIKYCKPWHTKWTLLKAIPWPNTIRYRMNNYDMWVRKSVN